MIGVGLNLGLLLFMAKELILIVEDESRIANVLESYLKAEGYTTEYASDGKRALELWRAAKPDLILLDLLIPEIDGIELTKTIRKESEVPIIMITAKTEEIDKLIGLELGADDYITKPFSPREVVARVKAILRRSRGHITKKHYLVGDLSIDLNAVEAKCDNEILLLSPTQFKLLAVLSAKPDYAFSRAELRISSKESFVDERTVDAHIKNLRKRMGDCGKKLETVRGVGYRLRS